MTTTTRPTERPAEPGETCTCGRPATRMYLTERFGAVPHCGTPGGQLGGRYADRRAELTARRTARAAIGAELRALRVAGDLTPGELAELAGLSSPSVVHKYESDHYARTAGMQMTAERIGRLVAVLVADPTERGETAARLCAMTLD